MALTLHSFFVSMKTFFSFIFLVFVHGITVAADSSHQCRLLFIPATYGDASTRQAIGDILADKSVPSSKRISDSLQLFLAQRIAALPTPQQVTAQNLMGRLKVVDETFSHFATDPTQSRLPSPGDLLRFQQKVQQFEQVSQNAILIQQELMYLPSTYYFSVIGQLEAHLQFTYFPWGTMRNLFNDFINPLPHSIAEVKKLRLKAFDLQWESLQIIGKELMEEDLQQLKAKHFENMGLEAERVQLIRDMEMAFQLTKEQYGEYRWQDMRLFTIGTSYIAPKLITAIAAAVWYFFI